MDFKYLNHHGQELTRSFRDTVQMSSVLNNTLFSSFQIENEGELMEIMRDRDNLREMTRNLRQVVTDLTSYVNNCETQLNKTLLNELLDDTSGIDDCSSFQQLKVREEIWEKKFINR